MKSSEWNQFLFVFFFARQTVITSRVSPVFLMWWIWAAFLVCRIPHICVVSQIEEAFREIEKMSIRNATKTVRQKSRKLLIARTFIAVNNLIISFVLQCPAVRRIKICYSKTAESRNIFNALLTGERNRNPKLLRFPTRKWKWFRKTPPDKCKQLN